ncbi:MAG: hypothetical protein ACRDJO_12290 [Actinomycetota bacterium]
MNLQQEPAPEPFPVGVVVEMLIDDPTQDYRGGDRGTVLLRDALGDLHIDFERGGVGVWSVAEAQAQLRVVEVPTTP